MADLRMKKLPKKILKLQKQINSARLRFKKITPLKSKLKTAQYTLNLQFNNQLRYVHKSNM